MTDFKFSWEQTYLCPKCKARMLYKPEREKFLCGVGVVNWYMCSKCEFKTKGVFDLIRQDEHAGGLPDKA